MSLAAMVLFGEETMSEFVLSTEGRIMAALVGLGAIVAGALALAGPGSHVLYVIAAVPPVWIVGAIVAVGVAATRSPPLRPILMLLVLPFAAGPYVGLLYAAPKLGFVPGVVFLAVGLVPLGVLVRRSAPGELDPVTVGTTSAARG
jgi:hypothetical protein